MRILYSVRLLGIFILFFRSAFCLSIQSHPLLTQERLTLANTFYEKKFQPYHKDSLSALEHLQRQMNVKNALATQNWYDARHGLYQFLATNPDDFQSWFLLCLSLHKLLAQEGSHNEKAFDAALTKAMQNSKTALDRAVIIWLGSSLPSLRHYRESALLLATEKEIQTHSQFLIKQYPRQFAPYFVDIPQKTDVACACISWTHPLKAHSNYEDWITLTPKVNDLSVIARGNQLCLEGLNFGGNYKLALKSGLPSAQDTALTNPQVLNLYIPHRKPAIRFKERGYILPSHGPQVLPLVSVNLSKVDLTLIHIPERNIRNIQSNWFSNQFSRWSVDELKREKGEILWEGPYYFPQEMDKAIISGLPIREIIGRQLKPGLYVIEARASQSYDEESSTSQSFIISDIGLSTYMGPDGLHVYARSLESAKPLENVVITLIARHNQVLGSLRTNKEGQVSFSEKIINGKDGNRPAYLTASLDEQGFTVLNLRDQALDLRARGGDGRSLQGFVEGFITTERGIYRPGETVNLLSLLRNKEGHALSSLPLILKIIRPDGVIAEESVLQDIGTGAYTHEYLVDNTSQTGTWSVLIFIDPKSQPIGYTAFEVNDFTPPRIEVKTQSALKTTQPHQAHAIDINAQYYFGPPGANLVVEAESTLSMADNPFPEWKNYHYGLEEEKWVPQKFKHPSTKTDLNGHALINAIVENELQTTHLLQLETKISVLEPAGRGKTSTHITPFWHQPFVIGISPRFKARQAPTHAIVDFDIIGLNADGKLQTIPNLHYSLYEEEYDYVWFRSGIHWQYEVVIRDKIISTGTLSLNETLPTLCQVPVKYGNYRLEVLDDKTGTASSVRFSAGWSPTKDSPDKPDIVELEWEKCSTSKDTATLFIKSPFEGELFVAWAGEQLTPVHQTKIGTERIKLEIPLSGLSAASNNYLVATVYRPANNKNANMPGRAIGVIWFNDEIALLKNKIDLHLDTPNTVESGQLLNIKVKLDRPTPSCRLAVMIVDEGTLSLTEFKTPDPFQYFFAQKSLSYELRDSYGFLINPFGTRPGSFDMGAGDELFQNAIGALPGKAHPIVSWFSGVINTQAKASISLDFVVPSYTGKLRCMVLAWDEKGLGQAQSAILIQDKVDLHLALPRFLTPNHRTMIPVTLSNLSAPQGEYTLLLETANAQISKKFNLQKAEQTQFPIELQFSEEGLQPIKGTLKGPQGYVRHKTWQIPVRSTIQPIVLQKYGQIEAHQRCLFDSTLLTNLETKNAQVTLTIAGSPHFGSTKLIKELVEYPYDCLEQTSSRILATLFNQNVSKSQSQFELNKAFGHLSTLQKIDGSFGLWSTQEHTQDWLTLYTADMLSLAKKQGYIVPKAMTDSLLSWLREVHQYSDDNPDLSVMSYLHYLMAKENYSSLQSLRFFSDTYQNKSLSRAELAFIAAAFAHYGDQSLAAEWFTKSILGSSTKNDPIENNKTFGSDLRDTAILVTLLAETTLHHPQLLELAQLLRKKTLETPYLSTQEKAWLIRADIALERSRQAYHLLLDSKNYDGSQPLIKKLSSSDLEKTCELINNGNTPIYYALSISAEPQNIDMFPQSGFEIRRDIYQLNGQVADLSNLKSGELYVVVLNAHRLNKTLRHTLIVDLLPPGFEIENAKLLNNNDFLWLTDLTQASRLDGRDDRFIAAVELKNHSDIKAAYLVRAVTAGKFIYPRTYIEAMFQPQYFKYGLEQSIVIHSNCTHETSS